MSSQCRYLLLLIMRQCCAFISYLLMQHSSEGTRFIHLCHANRNIVIASFVLSIVYNIIGLFFAVQGTLSPLIAAILMPSSSLSILLITFGSSSLMARRMKL